MNSDFSGKTQWQLFLLVSRCFVGVQLDREGLNGLTDRRKTAKTLVDSRKYWKIFTVSRKYGKKELTVKEIVP